MASIRINRVINYDTSIEVNLEVVLVDYVNPAHISGIYEKNGTEMPVNLIKLTNAEIKNSRQRINQTTQNIKTGINMYRFKQPNRNVRWSASNNLIIMIKQADKEIYRLSIRCPPKNRKLIYVKESAEESDSDTIECQDVDNSNLELIKAESDDLKSLNEKIVEEDNKICQLEIELKKHKTLLEEARSKKRRLLSK